MEDVAQRKVLSALSHGALFFSSTVVSIGIPIAIMFVSEDPVVKENAKESLIFHINLYIYAAVFALLILIAIGIPLLVMLLVVSFIMPLIAMLRVLDQPNRPYRYPYIFRFI